MTIVTYDVHYRCANDECPEFGACWRVEISEHLGAPDLLDEDSTYCDTCGERGEPDE
jgi:hypothetical protein